MSKSAALKISATLAAIALLLWFNQTYLKLTPTEIRTWILSFGWWAPLLYVVLYTVRPLILFPASLLSLAGGLAFGALWGTVFTVIGATAGAVISFAAARYLGKTLVRMEWKGNMKKAQLQLVKRGLLYVLLLRLIPLFPFDLISYLSGVSRIRFRSFFIGTLFGIIPGTFAYNFLGLSFAKGGLQDILIAATVFLAALAIPVLFRKRLEGDVQ
jgi:uncharacterized membrane protein YdjX (TVP38/TMEM64 family)